VESWKKPIALQTIQKKIMPGGPCRSAPKKKALTERILSPPAKKISDKIQQLQFK
jgi:hypothetical protein